MGYPKEEIKNSTINMGRLLYLEREDERFWIISKGTYLITQLGTYKPIYLQVPHGSGQEDSESFSRPPHTGADRLDQRKIWITLGCDTDV